MIDLSFIKRCNEELKPQIAEKKLEFSRKHYEKCKRWNLENPDKFKKFKDDYENSERGKQKRKEINRRRKERIKKLKKEITVDELQIINQFYLNCPKGYVVDHILPVSKGGKHTLSNLQYLTPLENYKKAAKLSDQQEIEWLLKNDCNPQKIRIDNQNSECVTEMTCDICENVMRILSEVSQYCESCNKIFEFSTFESEKPSKETN